MWSEDTEGQRLDLKVRSLVLENQKLQKELERQKVYETNARENIEMLGKYFLKKYVVKSINFRS